MGLLTNSLSTSGTGSKHQNTTGFRTDDKSPEYTFSSTTSEGKEPRIPVTIGDGGGDTKEPTSTGGTGTDPGAGTGASGGPTGSNQLPGGGYGGPTPGGGGPTSVDDPSRPIRTPQMWQEFYDRQGFEYDGGFWYDPESGQAYNEYGQKVDDRNRFPMDPQDPFGDGPVYGTPTTTPTVTPQGGGTSWDPSGNPGTVNNPDYDISDLYAEGFESEKSDPLDWTTERAGTSQIPMTGGGDLGQNAPDTMTEGIDPNDPQGYDAHTQEVDPNSLAGARANALLGQDSALAQRAQQMGMLKAASRGLQNTSLGAGAAFGELADRINPLALSEAEHLQNQALSNQNAINTARQFTAGLESRIDEINATLKSNEKIAGAQLQSDERKLGAQIDSQERMFTAEQQNQMAQFNANWTNQARQLQAEMKLQSDQFNISQQNAINMQILQMNTDLNKQYLAGTQAMDLATIQGQFNVLISQNQMAAEFFSSGMQAIGNAMANPELDPSRIASYVAIQQDLIASGLQLMADLNNINFASEDVDLGGGGSGGGGGGGGGGITDPFNPNFNWNDLTPQQQQQILSGFGIGRAGG